MTLRPYKLRPSGLCQSHQVRFNHLVPIWEATTASGAFHPVARQQAAFLILNGATITWFKPDRNNEGEKNAH